MNDTRTPARLFAASLVILLLGVAGCGSGSDGFGSYANEKKPWTQSVPPPPRFQSPAFRGIAAKPTKKPRAAVKRSGKKATAAAVRRGAPRAMSR